MAPAATSSRLQGCGGKLQRWWLVPLAAVLLAAAAAAADAPLPVAVPTALSVASSEATAEAGGPQPLGAGTAAVATAAQPKGSAAAGNNAGGGGGSSKFGMIVVFRDAATLARLRVMCTTSPLIFRLFFRGLQLPEDCHMPGLCKRIYTQTITGFSGEFGDGDVARLERCLPSSIFYKEPDGAVFKAEDSEYWHPADRPAERQQRQRQHQQRGVQRQRMGRRMHDVVQLPRVQAFEERQRTPSTEGGPIQAFNISQGRSIEVAGTKIETVTSRLWNLDRIDQRELPLDGQYIYGTDSTVGTGKGATIYVVDSGIRLSHQEFKTEDGSRSRAYYGYDFVEDDYEAEDCDGHGTHVAGTAIGLQVGVAKGAEVVAVRILDCTGSGTISDTVAGLDWVAANHKKPAIVTLSLGIQVGSWSRVLEDAVRSLINDHGVTVVVASGNSGVDACYVAPANVPEVITVAASNVANKYNGTKTGDPEDIYKWSNTGPCLDLFAPGVDVFSACGGPSRCEVVDDKSYSYASGTSMAVPAVAGVAAVYLGEKPDAPPREASAALTAAATQNRITNSKFKNGTPNRLLYSRLGAGGQVQAASGP